MRKVGRETYASGEVVVYDCAQAPRMLRRSMRLVVATLLRALADRFGVRRMQSKVTKSPALLRQGFLLYNGTKESSNERAGRISRTGIWAGVAPSASGAGAAGASAVGGLVRDSHRKFSRRT